jgi:hypothetical protein
MAYYLLLYYIKNPAKTINAVRAWGQQCGRQNIPRDGTKSCYFRAPLKILPNIAKGRHGIGVGV